VKINTSTQNEYFLLENRQKQGWDEYIPASGLLIYHVDENNGLSNRNPAHRGLYIKQAGGNSSSTSANRATDPYPQGANDSFTDISVPNSKSWAGVDTDKPVTDIIHNTSNKTITFQFIGGATTCPRPTEIHVDNITMYSADIYWTSAGTETSWKLSYKKRSESNFTEAIVTNSPYHLSDLDAGTNYDIQIKAICADEESSVRFSTFKTFRCNDMINYTIISYDSYGDSWNGNQLLIKQNEDVVAIIETPSGVSTATHTVQLCPCEVIEAVWIRGSYSDECSFEIKDNNNVQIFASGRADCASYSNNQVVFRAITTCSIIPPTVITNAATEVTLTTATLNKTVTAGEEAITGQGVKYKKISETTWQTSTTGILTDLTPYTQYEFYAYATTATYHSGVNGETLTFTTLDCDDVLNYTVVSHSDYGYGWIGSQLLIKQNDVVMATIELPYGLTTATHTVQLCPCETIEAVWVRGNYPEICSFEIRDNNNVVIFASGTACAGYSDNQVVYIATTTCSIIPPTSVTNDATEVTQTTATLHKTITAGEETITSQGFKYKIASESTWQTSTTGILTGLIRNTKYEFYAYATTATYVNINGEVLTFTTLNCEDAFNYTVVSHDSYGDGWSGNQLLIKQNNIVVATIELLDGTSDTHIVSFCPCETFEVVWVRGSYPRECSFEIKDNNNVVIFASGEADCANYSNNQVVYTSTTTCSIIPPIVITNAATEITLTTATLKKTVTVGEETITGQGFKYKKVSESTWQTSETGILTGLTPYTQYQFYAYATTATYLSGINGEISTFTTLDCDDVLNYTVVSHADYGYGWNGNKLLIKQNSIIMAIIETPYGSTTATHTVQLCPCETIEAVWIRGSYPEFCSFEIKDNNNVQIFASGVTDCTNYSNNQVVFSTTTTCSIIPPTVITNAATEVTLTTATLNKTVTEGEETITGQGFKYKKTSESTWQTSETGILTDLTPYTQYQFYAYATTATYISINGEILAFATSHCNDALIYTIISHDYYGDSWEGNQLLIKQNGVVIATIEPQYGTTTATHTVPFCPCETFEAVWIRGYSSGECSFEIKDNNNVQIFAAERNDCANYSNNQVVYSTTTTCSIIPPTVVTNDATEITQATATLNKTVTAGEETIIEQGFKYKKASETTWQTSETGVLAYLKPNVLYEFYAYAKTETYSSINGETLMFTTSDCDYTLTYTVISHDACEDSWNGNQLLIRQNGVVMATIEMPYGLLTDTNTVQLCPCTTIEAVWISGRYTIECSFEIIDNNNVQIFAAGGNNCANYYNNQVVYSDLTTCYVIPPTVITNAATEVTLTTVMLNKTVTAGEESITEQGFRYKRISETTWRTSATGVLTDLVPYTQYEFYAYASTTTYYNEVKGETLTFTTLDCDDILNYTVVFHADFGYGWSGNRLLIKQNDDVMATIEIPYGLTTVTNTVQLCPCKTIEAVWVRSGYQEICSFEIKDNNNVQIFAAGENDCANYNNNQVVYSAITTCSIIPLTVITNAATEVKRTTATLNKTVIAGEEAILEQGFKYKKISESTWQTSETGVLTDLTRNTQYEFYAYATTATFLYGVKGKTLTFTTPICDDALIYTVVLHDAYGSGWSFNYMLIKQNGVVMSTIEMPQGVETAICTVQLCSCEQFEVVWMPGFFPERCSFEIIDNNNVQIFAASRNDCAGYRNQIVYSNLTTCDIIPPTVITNAATEVKRTSATLNKTVTAGEEAILEQGFKYRRPSESTWQTSTTGLLTELTPNIQYQFYAYATTATYLSGINGEILTFRTGYTSTEENPVQNLQIFPNPVRDEIFIKSDSQIEKVELYSLTGNLLLSESNFNEKISVFALSPGVYMLKVYTDKGWTVSKVVKE
jgi:Fibronectin type III domain.